MITALMAVLAAQDRALPPDRILQANGLPVVLNCDTGPAQAGSQHRRWPLLGSICSLCRVILLLLLECHACKLKGGRSLPRRRICCRHC